MSLRVYVKEKALFGEETYSGEDHDKYRCPNPAHDDVNGSFAVYENGAHCYGCGLRMTASEIYAMPVVAVPYPEKQQQEKKDKKKYDSPQDSHPKYGVPTATWNYTDNDGNLMCVVYRFDIINANGEMDKTIRHMSRTSDGMWTWGGVQKTGRPIYNLAEVLKRPDAIVVIAEGEKTADAITKACAAYGLDMVGVASMNGAESPHKTDWSPLTGRDVWIWPDFDEPGTAYMNSVMGMIYPKSLRVFNTQVYPEGTPGGFDAADMEDRMIVAWLQYMLVWEVARTQDTPTADSNKPRSAGVREFIAILESFKMRCTVSKANVPIFQGECAGEVMCGPIGAASWKTFVVRVKLLAGVAVSRTVIEDVEALITSRAYTSGLLYAERYAVHEKSLYAAATKHYIAKFDNGVHSYVAYTDCPVIMRPQVDGEELTFATPYKSLKEYVDTHFSNFPDSVRPSLAGWIVGSILGKEQGMCAPVALFVGQPGSGKSTTAKMLKNLIDPSVIGAEMLPSRTKDVAASLSRAHVILFDNVTKIRDEQASVLCIAATGGAYTSRALYSNFDTASIQLQCSVIMTAVELPTTAGDLIDRMLVFELENPDVYVSEKDIMDSFEADVSAMRMIVLWAVSMVKSGAIPLIPAGKFRFAEWDSITRTALALCGYSLETVVNSATKLKDTSDDLIMQGNVFLEACLPYIKEKIALNKGTLDVTYWDLLTAINSRVPQSTRECSPDYPKTMQQVGVTLRKYTSTFRSEGISLRFKKNDKLRTIVFTSL